MSKPTWSNTQRVFRHVGLFLFSATQIARAPSHDQGAAFDRAYTKDMISGHEKAIAKFETEAQIWTRPGSEGLGDNCALRPSRCTWHWPGKR